MKKCALVIGHKKQSPGAINQATGINEFDFNEGLAISIEGRVAGVTVQRIYRRTYESLPGDINEFEPDFIISLHCNAFDRTASGTEVLYYHKSDGGKLMAQMLQKKLVDALQLRDRGIKAISSEDRGGYLLKNTLAPCVISEPFFIDNNADLKVAQQNHDALADAFAESIEALAGVQEGVEQAEVVARPSFTLSKAIAINSNNQQNAATDFYRNILGFAQSSEKEQHFCSGGLDLYIENATAGAGPMLELLVDDVELARQYLLANGCEVVKWQGAGSACIVRDPFGNCYNLWQS